MRGPNDPLAQCRIHRDMVYSTSMQVVYSGRTLLTVSMRYGFSITIILLVVSDCAQTVLPSVSLQVRRTALLRYTVRVRVRAKRWRSVACTSTRMRGLYCTTVYCYCTSTVGAHVVRHDHARTLVVHLHGRLHFALQVLLLAQVQQQVRAQVRPVHAPVA